MGRGCDKECVVIEICAKCKPCNGSLLELFEEHASYLDENVIYCDFFLNAHSTLWGRRNDDNGMVIDALMENKNLVCWYIQ